MAPGQTSEVSGRCVAWDRDYQGIHIQRAWSGPAPDDEDLRLWSKAALQLFAGPVEICIRIVSEREGAFLNARYRKQSGATNVLAFPVDAPAAIPDPSLGDVVICGPLANREAAEQGKTARAHWAHLIIHGVLHLLGYDHQEPQAAAAMEAWEVRLLASLAIPDPYGDVG